MYLFVEVGDYTTIINHAFKLSKCTTLGNQKSQKKNHKKPHPANAGFFFTSTQLDEHRFLHKHTLFTELINTIKNIKAVSKTPTISNNKTVSAKKSVFKVSTDSDAKSSNYQRIEKQILQEMPSHRGVIWGKRGSWSPQGNEETMYNVLNK